MIICITGTPATGKTELARILKEKLNYPVLDVKKFIKDKKLSEGYDKEKKCEIVDVKRLNKEILGYLSLEYSFDCLLLSNQSFVFWFQQKHNQ